MPLKKMPDHSPYISCRIICIGNRLFQPDSAGPHIYDLLSQFSLPQSIELIDGGLAGLNLLCFFENVQKILFVDNVEGFLDQPGIITIKLPSESISVGDYGHDAGLGYLMTMAPKVIDSKMPECSLIGVEGPPDKTSSRKAALRCLELAGIKKHDDPVSFQITHSMNIYE